MKKDSCERKYDAMTQNAIKLLKVKFKIDLQLEIEIINWNNKIR